MKRLEHIERCHGIGELFRERTLRFQVTYDLDIYQELDEPSLGVTPVPGKKEIRGCVTGFGEDELWSPPATTPHPRPV